MGAYGELGAGGGPLEEGGVAEVGLELLNFGCGEVPDWDLTVLVLQDGEGFAGLVPLEGEHAAGAGEVYFVDALAVAVVDLDDGVGGGGEVVSFGLPGEDYGGAGAALGGDAEQFLHIIGIGVCGKWVMKCNEVWGLVLRRSEANRANS